MIAKSIRPEAGLTTISSTFPMDSLWEVLMSAPINLLPRSSWWLIRPVAPSRFLYCVDPGDDSLDGVPGVPEGSGVPGAVCACAVSAAHAAQHVMILIKCFFIRSFSLIAVGLRRHKEWPAVVRKT